MKQSSLLVICAMLLGAAGPAWSSQRAGKRSHFTEVRYGLSFDAPRFPDAPAPLIRVASFSAPRDPAGTSNVDVMVQKIKTSRQAFLDLSFGQYKAFNMKVNSHTDRTISGREALEMDIQGTFPGFGKELRQLQLAAFDPGHVILITCTATPEAFQEIEPEFRACLASLRLGAGTDDPPKARPGRSIYADETYGFRLDLPRFRALGPGESCRLASMTAPPVGGFSSNVGGTVGPPKTRQRVREESAADFAKPEMKLKSERDLKVSGRDAVEVDSEKHTPDGRVYRMLGLIVLDKDRTYMVACIAPSDSFPQYEAEFRACLESFALAAPNP